MRNVVAATTAAGGPFSFAATEIRIGRGRSLPQRLLQAGHSPLRRRKLESDAEEHCRNDCCMRNYSPLHRFASLSPKSRITARWRTFLGKTLQRFASLGMKSRIDAAFGLFPGKTLHRFPSLGMKSRIDAAFGLFLGKTLHRFPSLGMKSRIDARKGA